MDSLQTTENAAAAVAKTPNRVSLDSLKEKIDEVEYIAPGLSPYTTIAVVRMKNGFVVVGTSTPADPANFDPDLGRQFAREDAIRQLWRLEGYALRERMTR